MGNTAECWYSTCIFLSLIDSFRSTGIESCSLIIGSFGLITQFNVCRVALEKNNTALSRGWGMLAIYKAII